MMFFWNEFWVGKTIGEEGVAAALDGFDDGETKVFLVGGADDYICGGKEFEIVVSVFEKAVVYDVVLELGDEGCVGVL